MAGMNVVRGNRATEFCVTAHVDLVATAICSLSGTKCSPKKRRRGGPRRLQDRALKTNIAVSDLAIALSLLRAMLDLALVDAAPHDAHLGVDASLRNRRLDLGRGEIDGVVAL